MIRAFLLSALFAVEAVAQPSEIYVNARVYTVDSEFSVAEAFAVEDGHFTAVGPESEIRNLADDSTRVIDLHGRTVLPGLIDAHGHMFGLGRLQLGVVDLTGTTSFEQVIRRVVEQAEAAEPGEWIIGRGWDNESWKDTDFPTHDRLSAAVPDNPVWLSRVDGHAALANARALEQAEISAGTAAPAGGEIIRDEQGHPTGVFIDNATALFDRVIPGEIDDPAAIIDAAQSVCLRFGLTGVHDAGVEPDLIGVYREMEASGRLNIRVYGMVPGQQALTWFETHEPYEGPFFSMRSAKLYMDGAMGSRGAWMLEPYADRPVDAEGKPYTGLAVSDTDLIRTVARHALLRDYQVCTHAIGDRANREVLDAYEWAFNNVGHTTQARFRIEHAQLLAPDDIGRFARLGVIPSMQPTHCTSDMRWVEDRVGPVRADGAYAWQSLLSTGVRIAGGSDFPVESANPFLGIYAAVTRQNLEGEPAGGWHPSERVTREQALRMFTIDAAYAGFAEDRLGSIEPGKLADFIVIDRDIMQCEPRAIADTVVLRTIVGGKEMYNRNDPEK
ncbi:MAG TPA: amidohydrolase [Phycisphaerales bacterium]|nr:amidohydrolase [Phycisphaerales bacterium]